MTTFPGTYAVPGAAWPGSIWAGEVIPATTAVSPVIFAVQAYRNRFRVMNARNSEGGGMSLTMAAASTDDVQVLIQAIYSGVAGNPSADPVAMAFVPLPSFGGAAAPAVSSGAWNTASWETDPGPQYWITCLVGPQNGGVVLTSGSYQVYVKITDTSSVPVLPGPVLIIT